MIEETTKSVVDPALSSETKSTPQTTPEPCFEFDGELPQREKSCQREEVRHVLLGSPEAIRQTMRQLHVLDYAESVLWSPMTAVGDKGVTVDKAQGEAMSLLRRPV